MSEQDPEFEAWVQRARDGSFETAMQLCGFSPQKGYEKAIDRPGPCPACGGDDRFAVHVKKRAFNCRGCGVAGYDALSLALVGGHADFIPACTALAEQDPPRRASKTEPRPIDHEAERARHEARQDKEIIDEAKDHEARAKKANRSQKVFDDAKPIRGTWGEKYFRARGIYLAPETMEFLRFAPAHKFFHGENEDGSQRVIGIYPAIIALMRGADGAAMAMHCTYLDSLEPIKAKVVDPDTGNVIAPRKMYGTSKGPLIWLSQPRPVMAIGEGIETTTSWFQLGIGPDDVGIAAAGSIGNLAGDWTGRIKHPTMVGKTIPNGTPDMAGIGMALPEVVKEVIFLGDADKNSANTRAHILTGMRRERANGRAASVHMSPLPDGETKWDWNDELRARLKAAA